MRNNSDWQKVGDIGVDAGLCWLGDPCYIMHKSKKEMPKELGKDWGGFVDKLYEKPDSNAAEFGNGLGVAVSTGYGDGCYPVYVKRNHEGRVIAALVAFDEIEEVPFNDN